MAPPSLPLPVIPTGAPNSFRGGAELHRRIPVPLRWIEPGTLRPPGSSAGRSGGKRASGRRSVETVIFPIFGRLLKYYFLVFQGISETDRPVYIQCFLRKGAAAGRRGRRWNGPLAGRRRSHYVHIMFFQGSQAIFPATALAAWRWRFAGSPASRRSGLSATVRRCTLN